MIANGDALGWRFTANKIGKTVDGRRSGGKYVK
jgi:hypothetical protein